MSNETKQAVIRAFNAGLDNDQAHALRQRVAREIPQRLAENGQRLSIHHHLEWSAAGIGFATATEMTSELGEGAARLFDAELWYPGAALVRQLIECIYLLTLMAERREEAQEWMTSTRAAIMSRFQPKQMRKRSDANFRSSEYQVHCDNGGHPNPAGRGLLRRHDEWRQVSTRGHWLDLAQHLDDAWRRFVSALPLYDPRMDETHFIYGPERSPDGGDEIAELLTKWYDLDPIARPVPVTTDGAPAPWAAWST